MELFYVGYVKGAETEFELLVSFCSTHEFQKGIEIIMRACARRNMSTMRALRAAPR